jgi:thioesterase domain-containing protein/acyl carrier protein
MDHQVKVKGYRIELSEIENQLLKLKEIKEAVIVVNQSAAGDKYLCAFVVSEKPLMKLEVIEYLKRELPAYMVPAYVIQLEKMPLNPNGKIHRKALPDPIKVLNIGKTSATPTDETEKKIVSIWSEVLGIESHQIALEDNFFELGGNSINCLKVINSISRVFDLKISMADIFVNPTIKMLANTIKQETLLNQSECVVKLNRGNPNKKLFIVHSGEGVVYIYKKLAKLLEDEFTIYGIQAKGLFQKSKLPKNSKELIGYYLEEIKMVQENGPYIIAGYCGAGTICAYELTRMLEDQGEWVKHLIIVDEPPFITGFYIKFLHTKQRILKLLKNIPIFSNSKRNTPPPTGLEKAEKIAEDMLEQRKKNVLDNLRKVLKKVKPARIINTSILVIKARDTRSLRLNKNHWSQMTNGEIRLVEVRGNHESILHVPYVNKIVKTIKKLN